MRPPTKQPNQFRPYKSSSIPHLDIKSISTTHTNSKSFYMLALYQVTCGPNTKTKPISIIRTKPRQSIPTLKTSPHTKSSQFRSPHKNQLNCDHPHNNQINFIPTSQVRSLTLTSSQFRPPTKRKSFSMLTLQPSELRPAYKNQVNFDHPKKTKSIDPYTKNK